MKTQYYFNKQAEVCLIERKDFIYAENEDASVMDLLTDKEYSKLQQYKSISAKTAFLTARYYLRELLSKKLNIENPKAINIVITESGKPFLADYPSLFFNISHSKEMIVIGFSNSPIGVDVETIDRKTDKESILKHFFSEKEQESYLKTPEEMRNISFFVGWTRKEAILKATGYGLSKMKNNEVSFDIYAENPVISDSENISYKLKTFFPNAKSVVSVALQE